MRVLLALPLIVALGCAGASAAKSKSMSAAAGQSCGDLMSGIALKGTGVYPGPDDTLKPIRWLDADTPVCAGSRLEGFGFRRVTFADGSTGYVQDEYLSL